VTARGVGGLGAERGDVCLRHVADLVTLPASAPYRFAIVRASSAPTVRIMNRPLDQFPALDRTDSATHARGQAEPAERGVPEPALLAA
jgi:hypothetical protein